MATPEITVEEREKTQAEAACCCEGAHVGRGLGLALLGAAIIVPATIYYLSKRLWTKAKASVGQRRRPSPPEPPTQRITIPMRVVASDEESQTEEAATLRVPAAPASAVEVVATEAEIAPFVGSTESDKFHRPGCRWAQNIQTTHRISFPSREVALERGYVACNTCKP